MKEHESIVNIEKIFDRYDNKYKAVIIGALEARRLKELQKKHLYDVNANNIQEALKRLLDAKIKFQEK